MTSRRLPASRSSLESLQSRLDLHKTERDAEARATRLADRLADVDLHQREARFMLERAGLLTRRKRDA